MENDGNLEVRNYNIPRTSFERKYGNSGGEFQNQIEELQKKDLEGLKNNLYKIVKDDLDNKIHKDSFVIAKDGQFDIYLHEENNNFRVFLYEKNLAVSNLPFLGRNLRKSAFHLKFCEPKTGFPIDFAAPYFEKLYKFDVSKRKETLSKLTNKIREEYYHHNPIKI